MNLDQEKIFTHSFLKSELGIPDMDSFDMENDEITKRIDQLNKVESLNLRLKLGTKLNELDAGSSRNNSRLSAKNTFLLTSVVFLVLSFFGFGSLYLFSYWIVFKLIVLFFSSFWLLVSFRSIQKYFQHKK